MLRGDSGGIAIVTGCAAGIGLACTKRFLESSWTVVGIDCDEGALRRVSGELGSRFAGVRADVRREREMQTASSTVAGLGGGVQTVLLNVAGVYPPSTLESASSELYREIFSTNVWGVINATRTFAGALAGGGRVVNFASIDGLSPSPGQLLYSASKAAVIMLTRALGRELASRGIRVNGIAPGWVDTERNRAGGRMEAALADVPLGRAATPEEIAECVYTLATASGFDYMTGCTLTLAGGVVV